MTDGWTIEELESTVARLRTNLEESQDDEVVREQWSADLSALAAELEGMWRERISRKVMVDDRWAMRALLALYRDQTLDEQISEQTFYRNGIGFNAADAWILTSLAKQLEKRGTLSTKQVAILHRTLPKYSGQLARMAVSRVTEAGRV